MALGTVVSRVRARIAAEWAFLKSAWPIYRICGECGHVYPTGGSLKRAYRRELWSGWRTAYQPRPALWWVLWRLLTIRASAIFFCQACIHDF